MSDRLRSLLTHHLWVVLSGEGPVLAACRMVELNASLRDELFAKLDAIEMAGRPLSRQDLFSSLKARGQTFGLPDDGPDRWTELLAPYLEALAEIPADALTIAWSRWRKGELYPKTPARGEFFPRPDELVELAGPMQARIAAVLERARAATEHCRTRSLPTGETPQQMAERLRAQAAQFEDEF